MNLRRHSIPLWPEGETPSQRYCFRTVCTMIPGDMRLSWPLPVRYPRSGTAAGPVVCGPREYLATLPFAAPPAARHFRRFRFPNCIYHV